MKGFRGLIKLIRGKPSHNITKLSLSGQNDLPSIKDFVVTHTGNLQSGKNSKGMFTFDRKTLDVVQKVFSTRKPSTSLSNTTVSNFFDNNIFNQPDLSPNTAGSIKVLISDINDFPQYKQEYEAQEHKNSMLCVGGPAAEDQVVLAGIIKQVRGKLDDIVYVNRDYKESNVNHSAKQSHARHGNALNADEALSGHKLLPVLLMRKLIGVDLEDVLDPNYIKIDVEFTIDPKKLRIYFGNELNWLQQEYKKRNGDLTEHDINRLESSLSQEILIAIENQTGVKISGGLERAIQDSSSIHVNFSHTEEKHMEAESSDLARVSIKSKKLSPEKHEFFFGKNKHIHSAYEYFGDGHILFNAHEQNQKLAEQNDVQWLDGLEISRIFVKRNKQGNAEIVGALTSKDEYLYCNKLHFTGGYKVDYTFDPTSVERFQSGTLRNLVNQFEDKFGIDKPLNNEITTATGVSVNAVFKKSPRLKRIIEKYGSTGEIAVTNSHWTMIADDDEHIIVRMTGGNNTGSEEYNPAYFLNLLANTRRIFGDDLIGILSTYGCPRAVNAKNSTEFAKIAEGGVISYGKGGTGNTKRHTEAAFGLMMVGFEKDVVNHFNQFQTKHGKPLGEDLLEAYKMADKVGFFHDNIQKTNRRMGYDESLSKEEMFAMGLLLVALSFGLYKGVVGDKSENKEASR